MSAPRECSLTEFLDLLRETLASAACWGVVLSQPFQDGDCAAGEPLQKLTARPVELFGERRYQLAERARETGISSQPHGRGVAGSNHGDTRPTVSASGSVHTGSRFLRTMDSRQRSACDPSQTVKVSSGR